MISYTPAPRRLSFRDAAAALDFQNITELQKFRLRCQREGVACPAPGPGGFLESEILAFKHTLVARTATQASSADPANSPRDRRTNIDRRKL